MFQSYKYIGARGEYELTDSEFGTVSGMLASFSASTYVEAVAVAVIQEYSERNLNVAANLVVAFNWISKQWKGSVKDIIDFNKRHNYRFSRYEEDCQKYLVLL
jgi:hypothetical protein